MPKPKTLKARKEVLGYEKDGEAIVKGKGKKGMSDRKIEKNAWLKQAKKGRAGRVLYDKGWMFHPGLYMYPPSADQNI